MWFLFILIQTHFHTINKSNCNLGEINWLSTLILRGGKNVGDEPQNDSQTGRTAFHNQWQEGKRVPLFYEAEKAKRKHLIKWKIFEWSVHKYWVFKWGCSFTFQSVWHIEQCLCMYVYIYILDFVFNWAASIQLYSQKTQILVTF